MGYSRQKLGRLGEELAAGYLEKQGFSLVQRNWRCSLGEVDIVAREGETIVFVEVRARRGDRFGSPEESLTPSKQTRLIDLAQTYLQENQQSDVGWRIDVIAIRLGQHGDVEHLNHIRHAVSASQ
jgi:putative endonuclease